MEKIKVTIGFAPGHYVSHCIVLSVPSGTGEKMCVLDQFRWRGLGLVDQVHRVVDLAQRYDVAHIGVDSSEAGDAALELLRQYFPEVKSADRRDAEMSDAYLCALDLDRRSRSTPNTGRSAW